MKTVVEHDHIFKLKTMIIKHDTINLKTIGEVKVKFVKI